MAEPFDQFARLDKDDLLVAMVPAERADAFLQAEPQRYRAVTFRLPFTRYPQTVVVDVSLLPAA